jgi:HSP20 family protein
VEYFQRVFVFLCPNLKNNLDISITREVVIIKGRREEDARIQRDQYYTQELYWGSFSRTIMLPEEVDVELADAKEEHGLLTITLPLIDKNKEAKLKVK